MIPFFIKRNFLMFHTKKQTISTFLQIFYVKKLRFKSELNECHSNQRFLDARGNQLFGLKLFF